MQVFFQLLHYAKGAFVVSNVMLCLTLLVRHFANTRRPSLLLLLVGLATIGTTVPIFNFILTPDLVVHDFERSQTYSTVFFSILMGALVACDIGLGWELVALYRRRSSME